MLKRRQFRFLTQGTAQELWTQKVAEGRCANLEEAYYVRKLSTYHDKAGVLTRVAQLCLWGERVYGLITTLPRGVWMVRHR